MRAALAAFSLLASSAAAASSTVSLYNISDPTYGSCRLKGITSGTDNFKYYASVSSKDESLNGACARCITITRDDDSTKSTTAFVLDVCDGCSSGTLQLSSDTMSALDINTTGSSVKVSYEFDSCPTSMMTGDIKACLMEGASATYVPLQFYNSQKVITGATIDGVTATKTSSSFLWSANSGSSSSTWYKSVEFSVSSDDGETLNSTFAFSSTSSCATSEVQFNSASTADGVKGSTSSSSSSSVGAIVGGVVGGVCAVLIIVGSVIFIRRRNHASKDEDPENDMENQYLSPTAKPKAAPAMGGAAAFQSDHDDHDDHRPLASPTVDYAESFSPAAISSKAPSSNTPSATGSNAPSSHLSDSPMQPAATTAAAAVPAAVVAAAFNVDSPASSAASEHSSLAISNESSARSNTPEPTYTEPTYAYSYNTAPSPRRQTSNAMAAPTLSAPVVPRQASGTGFGQYEDEEERSSFDIDDMREFDARATSSGKNFAPYSAADPYANTVTSPQSYVRATSLRRPNRQPSNTRMSGRESNRFSNNASMLSNDSYASTAPRQTNNNSMISNNTLNQSSASLAASTIQTPADNYSYSARSTDTMTDNSSLQDSYSPAPLSSGQQDLSASQRSLRESGGYSRESLNILGYPYSKKSGRHHNVTEMQF